MWRGALAHVLDALSLDDTRAVYRAIALAQPAGLGDVPEQSVHAEPSVDLRAAMSLAAGRDSIARQYANGFLDIFDTGLAVLRRHAGDTPLEAVTLDLFLTFVSRWTDSHIVRKHGAQLAQSVTREAVALRHVLYPAGPGGALPDGICDDPRIDEWDARLKACSINPGTSADLTVTTLFVAACLAPQRFAAAAQARDDDGNWHGKC
jgi:triphosphoribosyl-dephospho-CoA synthase